MKYSIQITIAIFLSAFLMSGCTLQKRQYRNGYHIDWITKNRKKVKESSKSMSPITTRDLNQIDYVGIMETPRLYASVESTPIILKPPFSEILANIQPEEITSTPPDSCDRIISRNGDIIFGKVLEIGLTSIRYKSCDHLDGPILNMDINSTFLIEYSNGKKKVFEEEKPTAKKSDYYRNLESHLSNQEVERDLKLDGFSVAAFAVGLASIPIYLFANWIVGLALAILALLFAVIGLFRTNKDKVSNVRKRQGRGFAWVGYIIGLIITFLNIFLQIL
jgi:hypothetical protein